ncbi:MAG: DEAD/DEAH box helicase family protein [Candidatus Aenigmarchaeota archaeon]|nr:DEAD/DEAH box helicase family protein [Candidatus Aenigmarchaeota archaeon]
MFIDHPWITPQTIEQRLYQTTIVKTALRGNTLVVLPTGLGKTNIAALVVAERFSQNMNAKVLFLAPTKPLVEQHKKSFGRCLRVEEEKLQVVTGENKPETRMALYKHADIIFSTPQTIENDLKHGLIDLSSVSLCIFDEAHHSVGNYAYATIAQQYMERAKNPLILALTASPGGYQYKINEVKKKLSIAFVEIRTRADPDVVPYLQELAQDWVTVELDEELVAIKKMFEAIKEELVNKLMHWKIIHSPVITKSQLIQLQTALARHKTGSSFGALSLIAEIIKLDHALGLLETQTIHALHEYVQKLRLDQTKAATRILAEERFITAARMIEERIAQGKEHPKIIKLQELITKELAANPEAAIIIFAQYRDTIEKITEALSSIPKVAPIAFIGQAKKNGKGMSQKEQVAILGEFKMGFYNI